MPLVAATIGAAVIGGGASIIASNRAARASQRATDQTVAIQQAQYQQARADQQPFMQAGYGSLDPLARQLGITPNVDWGAYVSSQPDVQQNWNALTPEQRASFNNDVTAFAQDHYRQTQALGQPRDLTPFTTPTGPQAGPRPDVAPRPQAASFTPGARQDVAAFTPAGSPALTAAPTLRPLSQQPGQGAQSPDAPQYVAPQAGPASAYTSSQAPAATGGPQAGGTAPSASAGPAAAGPNYQASAQGARPGLTEFSQSTRPEVAGFQYADRPDLETADTSIDAFQRDPSYDWARQQGEDAVLANRSLFGLENGAAVRAVSRYNQDYASTRYGDWRDYVTNSTNQRNALLQSGYESDRNASLNAWAQQQGLTQAGYTSDQQLAAQVWDRVNTLRQQGYTDDADRLSRDWQAQLASSTQRYGIDVGAQTSRYNTDVGAATSRYNTDVGAATDRDRLASENWYRQNQLGQAAYQFDTSTAADLYRFNTARQDANYNFDTSQAADLYRFDTARGDQNYQFDQTLQQDLYNSDRDYGRAVYNDRTNGLLQLANVGQGSAQSVGNIGANSANQSGNALLTNGANQGNAYLSAANSINSALSNGVSAYSYWLGNTGATRPTSAPAPSVFPFYQPGT